MHRIYRDKTIIPAQHQKILINEVWNVKECLGGKGWSPESFNADWRKWTLGFSYEEAIWYTSCLFEAAHKDTRPNPHMTRARHFMTPDVFDLTSILTACALFPLVRKLFEWCCEQTWNPQMFLVLTTCFGMSSPMGITHWNAYSANTFGVREMMANLSLGYYNRLQPLGRIHNYIQSRKWVTKFSSEDSELPPHPWRAYPDASRVPERCRYVKLSHNHAHIFNQMAQENW